MLDLIVEAGALGSKTVKCPMEHNSKLSMDEVELLNDPTMYRRMVGKLLYLTLTSPHLNYCVHRLT